MYQLQVSSHSVSMQWHCMQIVNQPYGTYCMYSENNSGIHNSTHFDLWAIKIVLQKVHDRDFIVVSEEWRKLCLYHGFTIPGVRPWCTLQCRPWCTTMCKSNHTPTHRKFLNYTGFIIMSCAYMYSLMWYSVHKVIFPVSTGCVQVQNVACPMVACIVI